jgi:hypothetical protein
MLWFFRKVCGAIVLTCLGSWLLFLITLWFDPRVAAVAGVAGFITLYVVVPAFIIWAVLKVISVLSTPRVAQPSPLATAYPPRQVPATSPLGLTTLGTLPQALRIEPPSKPSAAEPKVYTYSAPGIPMCAKCEQQPTIFYCSTHQSGVCLGCVAKHDEPGKCIYVPAFRAPKPNAET